MYKIKTFPIQAAYQIIVLCFVIIAIPLLWFFLFGVFSTVAETMMATFPNVFHGNMARSVEFQLQVWQYALVFVIIGGLIWLVMETMKEKRREMMYGY